MSDSKDSNNQVGDIGSEVSNKLLEARNIVTQIIDKLDWKEGFYRKDIGWKSIKKISKL